MGSGGLGFDFPVESAADGDGDGYHGSDDNCIGWTGRRGGLFLVGRTTAWTHGTVNAIKANIDITRISGNGEESNAFGKVIDTWVACNRPESEKFCAARDSGSLVFDSETADIVGLMFGSEIYTGEGYFMPFDVCLEDIEAVTGGKVIYPSKKA
ncbi:hypothetical protein AJ80_07657 [Polytolypa hystricis UAMH7299]|uniref:Uncharacterized protein n=1 Tax=Polytolypa hystricis (strain UAMH7299) TaxID=1447883 RepID=A0A2B7XM05_POLH7|nr:hypothetical protein AJ80_07657 [Polytolypa hystricis UAMH7299]